MDMQTLPSPDVMFEAFNRRDPQFDGVFLTAVRTTGIFCRPTCSARKPKRENVEFYASVGDALAAGYRACKRCRPLEPGGEAPGWVRDLIRDVEDDPTRRWSDHDLRERQLDPVRVRRWFVKNHGITFHAYSRARRLASALTHVQEGQPLTDVAYDHGFESLSGFRDAFTRAFGIAPGTRARGDVVLTRLQTPLGPMIAGATDDGICLLEFADRKMLETQLRRISKRIGSTPVQGTHPHIERLKVELDEYFAGKRSDFDVPLLLSGTEFQERVWNALLKIPYGETISYDELARRVGSPGGQRAVGRANGDNRIAIVIPCHRVIRASGELGGYGGGLGRKQLLLDLEKGSQQVSLF